MLRQSCSYLHRVFWAVLFLFPITLVGTVWVRSYWTAIGFNSETKACVNSSGNAVDGVITWERLTTEKLTLHRNEYLIESNHGCLYIQKGCSTWTTDGPEQHISHRWETRQFLPVGRNYSLFP